MPEFPFSFGVRPSARGLASRNISRFDEISWASESLPDKNRSRQMTNSLLLLSFGCEFNDFSAFRNASE